MGRPRKHPLPDLVPVTDRIEKAPVLVSLGVEKIGKLYSTFILKTSDGKVISKTNFQPDLKMSAQMVLHEQIVLNFINNENF